MTLNETQIARFNSLEALITYLADMGRTPCEEAEG